MRAIDNVTIPKISALQMICDYLQLRSKTFEFSQLVEWNNFVPALKQTFIWPSLNYRRSDCQICFSYSDPANRDYKYQTSIENIST